MTFLFCLFLYLVLAVSTFIYLTKSKNAPMRYKEGDAYVASFFSPIVVPVIIIYKILLFIFKKIGIV